MKRPFAAFLSLAAALAAPSVYAAEEGRFDAQVFRPLAAPRDLVMVPKSEVIGHLSPVVGLYWDAALDPLALVVGDTNKQLDVVGARLQITPLLGLGLFDWMELTMAIPFVAWQTSDNLRSIGTEGEVKSSPTIGDVRISSKVALPILNRKEKVKSGFGMAVQGNINLPTGDPLAFTSDGAISGGVNLIADYRWNFGLILASNLGVWIRPEHQFAGVKIGDMAQFGVAAEMYVVQRWGVSVIGEVYGYPSLTKYPDSIGQIPAEVLLGIRWQTRQGITITVGGSFGAACGFGAPAIRVFNSITWQPKSSNEQQEINRILERDDADPDGDGVIDTADKCPDKPGQPDNFGCPDTDTDGDGFMDREDECPDLAQGPDGKKGCPLARLNKDELTLIGPVEFESDTDRVRDSSKPVLESVVRVLRENPNISLLEIQAHTNVRQSDARSTVLSSQCAENVKKYLVEKGIDGSRLEATGKGYLEPIADDKACDGPEPEEKLSPQCREALAKNKRVVFVVKGHGVLPTSALAGGGSASVLPKHAGVLPGSALLMCKSGVSPNGCLLPWKEGVLKRDSVLGTQGALPTGDPRLPKGGSVLPRK